MNAAEPRQPGSSLTVSASWLREHIGDANLLVVDTRTYDTYQDSHLLGAVHLDLQSLRLDTSDNEAIDRFDVQLAASLRAIGLEAGMRTVFYEDFAGTNAARGVWLVDYAGLGGGAMLDGGVHAWVNEGGTLTQQLPKITPSQLQIIPNRATLARADDILTALDADQPPVIVDTRSHMEYYAGTIPGSIHLDWVLNLHENGTLKSAEELRTLYAAAGVSPGSDRPVITFCGSGFRAAHTYLALRSIGLTNVANYGPSWGEWGRRGDLPTEQP